MTEQEDPAKKEIEEIQVITDKMQLIVSCVVVAALIAFGSFALIGLTDVANTDGDYWRTLIREQFPVLVGLPMAGLGALFVTIVLKISTGPIDFEMLGLKFKGGAAQIVFWILCFLVIVMSINLLWQKPVIEDAAEKVETEQTETGSDDSAEGESENTETESEDGTESETGTSETVE